MPLAACAQFGCDLVQLLVLGDEGVDGLFGRRRDGIRQLVHAPGVHLHAEAQLGLGLVALGDRDEAHVVAEAGELQVGRGGEAVEGATAPIQRWSMVARELGVSVEELRIVVPSQATANLVRAQREAAQAPLPAAGYVA